jgi:tRNA A-37 threonylcarbamoyl transferase component Bud32/tetratricopeptide (TPR) repeat protein
MSSCPTEAKLRLVGTDAIGEATFADLEAHVEGCPVCQAFLEVERKSVPHQHVFLIGNDALPKIPGFSIERELGRGAANIVYLARETALGRDVALKLFPRHSLIDPHAREHWLAEARALSRVPHERVVAIHHVIETDDWLCLVLEYVAGGTLKQRLTEPLAPRDAARLMETIARAVGYFHARGLFHLDLKPSNILLEGQPEAGWDDVSPKIADFGLARLEGEAGTTLTGANGPKGTPAYMAPEQVAALPGTIKAPADLYSLGALMYHVLTGRPPFQGATISETLAKVRYQDPIPPRRLNGRIPRDLETICLTCLEKSPNRRYRSAEALADDLRLWLEGRPIKARRVSPLGHVWRLCRRHPAVASLLFVLAATLATGVVGLFVLLGQTEVERARLAQARRHAEAYERFSVNAANQLGDMLRITLRDNRNSTPSETKETLLQLLEAIEKLRGSGVVSLSSLGSLELELGWGLTTVDRNREALALWNQAIADLEESLANNPDDTKARIRLGEALKMSGRLASNMGEFEDALERFEQAVAFFVESEPSRWKYAGLTASFKNLQLLADRFGRNGQAELEKRSRHAGRRVLAHLLGSAPPDSKVAPDLGPEALALMIRHADFPLGSPADAGENRIQYEYFIAAWLVLSVGDLSPFRSESAAATFDRDPEARAAALVGTLRERCLQLCLDDSLVPAAIRVVATEGIQAAALCRKEGRDENARAIAKRLTTIATRLVREYPQIADSYWVLSQAHNQVKKNAVRSSNSELEEKSLFLAIEAAQRDLALSPHRLDSRQHFEKLTGQLAAIRASRKAEPGNTEKP